MGVARVLWLVTASLCLIGAVVLLVTAYYGYAIVTFVLALAAAINLT